ncbi:MAG: DNA-protecting protein DprA [Candidatus Nomurabacteria bacterium]|nr:MAG: DNA-protecting protein DprA [Candidatus Nomurabacteria bacterium]HRV76265.1 DNA-processing protein DprA [Candidatus Saccharimonadales bacterium]
MKTRHITIKDAEYPNLLKEIPTAPQRLWLLGAKLNNDEKRLTVVGTRKPTFYGKKVLDKLVKEVASAGVTIVSGLAIGTDCLAHQAALNAGGKTIAILPGGLDNIYPPGNRKLAQRILDSGGTLISEYPENTPTFAWNFVARNRIQSGISEAVLIIEAAEKSGTLITADFAIEQNRTLMAIPGNIDSLVSIGTNQLIKEGATPVTCAQDILEALGVNIKAAKVAEYKPENQTEKNILNLIRSGTSQSEEIQVKSKLDAVEYSTALTMLEIKGVISQSAPGVWDIK